MTNLCSSCQEECKQPVAVLVMRCPYYKAKEKPNDTPSEAVKTPSKPPAA